MQEHLVREAKWERGQAVESWLQALVPAAAATKGSGGADPRPSYSFHLVLVLAQRGPTGSPGRGGAPTLKLCANTHTSTCTPPIAGGLAGFCEGCTRHRILSHLSDLFQKVPQKEGNR